MATPCETLRLLPSDGLSPLYIRHLAPTARGITAGVAGARNPTAAGSLFRNASHAVLIDLVGVPAIEGIPNLDNQIVPCVARPRPPNQITTQSANVRILVRNIRMPPLRIH